MQIDLGKGYYTIIDDEDYEKISKYKWYSLKNRNRIIATARVTINKKRKRIQLHRIILNMTDPKIIVDHINRNTLDNRKCNLRICTNQQNCMNVGKNKNSTSGYKGVSLKRCINEDRWQSNIGYNFKHIYLGLYQTKEEAAKAYDRKALELFGDFAYLNFPELKEEYLKELNNGMEY